jgi:hypothetical protein
VSVNDRLWDKLRNDRVSHVVAPCIQLGSLISVDDAVVQAAEHDLTGALLDLITAVLALGEELLPGA